MNKIINVYKPLGATPLQVIQAVRKIYPEYQTEKIGYAGRLDPLAYGVLLLMIGEATKERDSYLNLEKEYEFEVLFGVKTDTYDMLGLLENTNVQTKIVNEKVNAFVRNHLGILQQSYPPYSSKAVNGKPLFWWARNKKLAEISIPTRKIVISSFILRSMDSVNKEDLKKRVLKTISLVSGDFRQNEILERWDTFINETAIDSLQTAKFGIACSSGTYVRGLINELGEVLGCGAIALDIKRTKVGTHVLKDSLQLLIAGK